MRLTDEDRKLIARLRAKEQKWRRIRKPMLIVVSLGLLFFLACLLLTALSAFAALAEPDPRTATKAAVLIAFWAPLSTCGTLICAGQLGAIIGRWSVPWRELLLRLAEEHEKNDA
jgi:hypothetical protein